MTRLQRTLQEVEQELILQNPFFGEKKNRMLWAKRTHPLIVDQLVTSMIYRVFEKLEEPEKVYEVSHE